MRLIIMALLLIGCQEQSVPGKDGYEVPELNERLTPQAKLREAVQDGTVEYSAYAKELPREEETEAEGSGFPNGYTAGRAVGVVPNMGPLAPTYPDFIFDQMGVWDD